MTANSTVALELDDIQAGALEPRPVPYAGVYQILRLDDRHAGREAAADKPVSQLGCLLRSQDAGVARCGTQLPGTQSLGVPDESLATSHPSSSREWPHARPSLGRRGERS